MKANPRNTAGPLPLISTQQLRWFTNYVRWYLQRNFHGLHLLRLAPLEILTDYPLLVCLNHPSWWDPLIGVYLSQRFFSHRRHYGPIAAAGIAKYKFFERLGFFAIEPGNFGGTTRFLRIGQAALATPGAALWVTPQGAFTDVRSRPIEIQPGIGYLAHRLRGRFAMLPVALEYSFWSERFPEAFACFGQPVLARSGADRLPEEWSALFSQSLEHASNVLAEHVQRRDAAAFEPLLGGRAGVGGAYDLWCACKARLQGKRWQPEHGAR
ncbi:MAG TPA: lysophospholipid acyltransferase family protein [Bryobacteraceae bacterium]|jgi:1-acyl-sn-glycerol-3-phosphate acyltransferase|nr:lysophospholipid acyltransferase family protein [Bryobacteraceae bacterium]